MDSREHLQMCIREFASVVWLQKQYAYHERFSACWQKKQGPITVQDPRPTNEMPRRSCSHTRRESLQPRLL